MFCTENPRKTSQNVEFKNRGRSKKMEEQKNSSNELILKAEQLFKWLAPYLVIALAIYLLSIIQLHNHRTIIDIDTMFHYNRFYDVSQQIKTGNYSYFQTNYGFNQSGRVVNALYGPMIAYLNGFLILVAGTWFNYQIISYWVLGLIGGIGMYQLARKAKANKVASALVSVLFLNIGAYQAWIDHTNMIAWGAVLVPYAFIEGLNMVQDHDRPIRWIRLMLIMSLIAQTHVISTILTALGLIPFAVYGFVKANNKRQMIGRLLLAVIGTTLLSSNVWGALLMIFTKNHIAPTLAHSLAGNAVSSGNNTIRDEISRMLVLVFLIQVLYPTIAKYNFKDKKFNKINLLVSLEGFIIFAISTVYFPWKEVSSYLPILRTYLQFPHRFLILAYPLLLVGLAMTMTQLTSKEAVGVTGIGKAFMIFTAFVTMQNYGANYARIADHSINLSRIFVVNQSKEGKYSKNVGVPSSEDMIKYKHGLTGDEMIYGEDAKDADAKYGKLYISSGARGLLYKNTTNIRAVDWATRTKEGRFKLFDLIEKINPDYLPVRGKKKVTAEAVDRSYIKHVVKPQESGKYKYSVQKNKLIITWEGKKRARRNLPLVMYKQSHLTVNDKKVKHPFKHSKSKVKTPVVMQKKGKNKAVLYFKASLAYSWTLFLALASWILLLGFGIYYLVSNYILVKQLNN